VPPADCSCFAFGDLKPTVLRIPFKKRGFLRGVSSLKPSETLKSSRSDTISGDYQGEKPLDI
jgi:hypothetical protein